MSTKSDANGKAFEYATVRELKNVISQYGLVEIVQNDRFRACERAWLTVEENVKNACVCGAQTAVKALFEFEPHLTVDEGCVISVLIQSDRTGEMGDVRDILITKTEVSWQIGISMKHNHFAVKHSRIAKNLDFGDHWYGVSCSREYWNDVRPIFDYLQILHNQGIQWNDVPEKEDRVYVPLLRAFSAELKRAYLIDDRLPQKITEYLMGKYDFYKVISVDAECCVYIQAYNRNKTLNTKCGQIKPVLKLQQQHLPKEMIDVRFKVGSKTTVIMYLDEGWTLSFRIHNASKYVESTLKFDIKLEGMPTDLMAVRRFWGQ